MILYFYLKIVENIIFSFTFNLYFIAGPRYRRPKQPKDKTNDEKRPRTAFSSEQLVRLKVSRF